MVLWKDARSMEKKRKIEIKLEERGTAIAEIDGRNPETADEIWKRLPIEADANLWQEEIYFDIPVKTGYENKSIKAVAGDISYWPPGNAFCIFYGKTQPVSEVNHIGKVIDNLEMLKTVNSGDKVILRALKQGD